MRRCGQKLRALALTAVENLRWMELSKIVTRSRRGLYLSDPQQVLLRCHYHSLPSKVPTDVHTKTSLNIDDISNTLLLFYSQIIIVHAAH